MPCRLRVLSFGWTPYFVYRHFVNLGIRSEDIVVLVAPKEVDDFSKARFEEAYQDVKRFLSSLGYASEPYLLMLEQDMDPVEQLDKLVEFLSRFRCEEYVFDVSGGMRIHNVLLLILALNLSQYVRTELYIGLESRPRLYRLPLALMKSMLKLSTSRLALLDVLEKLGGATLSTLSRELGKDQSYVRKMVKQLISEGLVERATGRQSVYAVTRLGRIALKLCKLVQQK